MNRKYIAFISLLIILAFIGYIIYDTIVPGDEEQTQTVIQPENENPDQWIIFREIQSSAGPLKTVTVSVKGEIYLGGDSYVSSYNPDLTMNWTIKTPSGITALAVDGDTIFASSAETIYLLSTEGKLISEWGPYEANSIITSISSKGEHVAFADAGIKRVFILRKNGEVSAMIGQSADKFIIPSPYFDVAFSGSNTLFAANTGNRRIETWTTDGIFVQFFGEPGTAPGAFCGCCNPAHFAVVPQGFVTSEKGINRIKILDHDGKFIEFVSSKNKFTPSIPLDIASSDGKTIYAANPADSKLYVYKRK